MRREKIQSLNREKFARLHAMPRRGARWMWQRQEIKFEALPFHIRISHTNDIDQLSNRHEL